MLIRLLLVVWSILNLTFKPATMMAAGLNSAVEELLPQLATHLERNLSVHLKSRLSVDDIVQDTYVRAMKNLGTVQKAKRTSLLCWLKRISHRLVIDEIRRKQSQQVCGPVASAIYAVLTASGQLTPSRECSAQEAGEDLAVAISQLGDEHRQVLRLRYMEQLDFAAIARQMNRTAASVRGLHRNALVEMRRAMGRASHYFST